MTLSRRLAAILAADVADYSRLMGADEEGTHDRLRAHLRELVHPAIEEHHGRVVKNTGDGMLVEFASAVDAGRCAVAVQRGMSERNRESPADQCVVFRIGINIGDVIVEPEDIYGDGVNIAARLEGLAEPGGICVSEDAFRHVRGKIEVEFADLGNQILKNIARPVHAYRAVFEKPTVAAATIRPLRDEPSIAVLPFQNLSGDPEQQYFADAITGNLTTDLSRIPEMLVISRITAFTYRNKPIDIKQIGRELGVRYILEGDIQRSGNQVRVSTQLIDAKTDRHLWAERFTGNADDLFALQDEITSRIAVALDLELVDAEASRPIDRPDTRDYILRGRAMRLQPPSPENRSHAIALFEQALTLDPQSAMAQSWLATALTARVLDFMAPNAAEDIARAEELADRALTAQPRGTVAHFAKAQVLRARHRYREAIPEYETVIALNRNWAHAYSHLGWCRFMTGSIEELVPSQEQAIRLSPRDPQIGLFYSRIGSAHLLQSRLDEAIAWYEKARNATPAHPQFRTFVAACYALKGDTERATAELAEACRLVGDDRYSSVARVRAITSWGEPRMRALADRTYFAGLRQAGLPEE